jgi:cell division protein FtsI/penicillin-binding protein 2
MTRRDFLATSAGLVLPNAGIQWMMGDDEGRMLRAEWQGRETAVSVGSLLKPFLVMAYAKTHKAFLMVECAGAGDGCWFGPGHGRQGVVDALANSCNVYFLHLAAEVDRAALDSTCLSYGLNMPERAMQPSQIIGFRVAAAAG